MGSIIIANPSAENAVRVRNLLRNSGIPDTLICCRTGSQVLELIGNRDADLVIVPRKLSDMGYEELLEYSPSYVRFIVITGDASLASYSDRVIRLLLPFRNGDLFNTVAMLRGTLRNGKKGPPKRTAGEEQLVRNAKQLLMERNGMTEPEAFRYLQKTSMDTGRSMVESAQMVLLLNSE